MCQWCDFTPEEMAVAKATPSGNVKDAAAKAASLTPRVDAVIEARIFPCNAQLERELRAAGYTSVFGVIYPWAGGKETTLAAAFSE